MRLNDLFGVDEWMDVENNMSRKQIYDNKWKKKIP